MAQHKIRIEEIDYLRGFAILAVVAGHASSNYTHIPNVNLLLTINLIINSFVAFCVPLFICLSGFVLSISSKSLLSKKSFYIKRAKSVLPQYFIFSMIYIILRIVLSTVNGNLTIPSTKTVIYYLLTTNSAYHLWFFALIVQFYVLYPYIMKVYNKFEESNKALYFVGLSLVFQLVWIVSVALIQDYLSSTAYFESIALFKFNHMVDRLFPSQMFYFILGIYACKNYKAVIEWVLNIKKWSLSIGLPIILVSLGTISALFINGIIEYGDYTKLPNSYFMAKALIESLYFPLVFLVFLVISLEFENVKNTYADIILSIGKYSFGIYLIHVVFIEIIIQVIYPYLGIGYNQWIFYPVLFLISLLLSYFSVRQISLTSYSEMIVGIKNAGPEPKLPA